MTDKTVASRVVEAVEAGFDEAVKQRFTTWSINYGSLGTVQDFVAGIFKLNAAREKVIAELAKLGATGD